MSKFQDVQKLAQQIESFFLAGFLLAFLLCVLPISSGGNIFTTGRLILCVGFLLTVLLLRLIGHAQLTSRELVTAFRSQPRYTAFLGLFLISTVASSLLSVEPSSAWFGNQSFPTGTLFILLGAALFWVYSSASSVRSWGWQAATVVMSLLTIGEFLGFRPLSLLLGPGVELNTVYPAVTIGYRGHVAGLLVMMVLSQLYLFRQQLRSSGFWTIFALACVALGCTSNTASYIAMIISLALFTLIEVRRGSFLVILVPVVALLAMNLYRPLTAVNAALISSGWVQQQASSKELSNTRTFSTRLLLWKAAIGMAEARPLLGWGAQTFHSHWYAHLSKAEGDRLFRLELGLPEERKMVRINDSVAYRDAQGHTKPDQLNYFSAHNAVLDLLYAQGVLGVLSFAAFVLALLRHVVQATRRSSLLALVAPLGYGIYLLGWFVTFPVTLAFCAFAGMLVSHLRGEGRNPESEQLPTVTKAPRKKFDSVFRPSS